MKVGSPTLVHSFNGIRRVQVAGVISVEGGIDVLIKGKEEEAYNK